MTLKIEIEPKELVCEDCEHGTDDSGYCLECYQGNKYTERKEFDEKAFE